MKPREGRSISFSAIATKPVDSAGFDGYASRLRIEDELLLVLSRLCSSWLSELPAYLL